tara:strand:- start:117 stop:296 length:180 start_codon:yes stop_codon:yes gene_type:complete
MTAKDGLTVKRANPVVVKKERSVEDILLVDLLWRSVLPLQRKRNHLSVLAGRIRRLTVD